MMTAEQLEEAESAKPPVSVDQAFVNSAAKRSLDGLVVQPYTPDREVAAQAMVLHYGYVDETGAQLFRRTRLYPGAVRDVAIVMWLCCKASEEEIDAAGITPKEARKKAVDWAKAEDLLNTGQDRFWQAFQMMLNIFDEVFVSRSKPKKKAISEEVQPTLS